MKGLIGKIDSGNHVIEPSFNHLYVLVHPLSNEWIGKVGPVKTSEMFNIYKRSLIKNLENPKVFPLVYFSDVVEDKKNSSRMCFMQNKLLHILLEKRNENSRKIFVGSTKLISPEKLYSSYGTQKSLKELLEANSTASIRGKDEFDAIKRMAIFLSKEYTIQDSKINIVQKELTH